VLKETSMAKSLTELIADLEETAALAAVRQQLKDGNGWKRTSAAQPNSATRPGAFLTGFEMSMATWELTEPCAEK